MAFRSSQETSLRVLQWKLLHNIYPSNILLNKMKVTENQNCPYCPDEVEFIEHFFFYCPVVQAFWKEVEKFIFNQLDIRVHLTVQSVIFGVAVTQSAEINQILLIGKMCVSIHRKTKSCLSIFSIFEKQIQLRKI